MTIELVIKPKFPLWKNILAGILSLLLPGLGQIYKKRYTTGILWFMFTIGGYFCLVAPGVVLHFYCVCYALFSPPKIKK